MDWASRTVGNYLIGQLLLPAVSQVAQSRASVLGAAETHQLNRTPLRHGDRGQPFPDMNLLGQKSMSRG